MDKQMKLDESKVKLKVKSKKMEDQKQTESYIVLIKWNHIMKVGSSLTQRRRKTYEPKMAKTWMSIE